MRAEPKAGRGSLFEPTSARKRAGVLHRRSEFEAVLRSRLRVASRNFVARASPNETGCARLGIIAGRKAAARAVDRNRGKRLIREAFRAGAGHLPGYDVTVQLRSDLRSQDNGAIQAELAELLQTLARRCAAKPRATPESSAT